MTIEGVIIWIGETSDVSGGAVKRRHFAVHYTDNPKYKPWPIKFTVVDTPRTVRENKLTTCDTLGSLAVGDKICIQFDIKGRCVNKEGIDKYYTYLECYRITQI